MKITMAVLARSAENANKSEDFNGTRTDFSYFTGTRGNE
jgi:hypothetical protein